MKLPLIHASLVITNQEHKPRENAMLGQTKIIAHPKSTNYDEDGEQDFATPPAKRVKREVPDSDADSDDELLEHEEQQARRTDLESALPPIQTDREAIEAYEAARAAEQAELGLKDRLDGQKWVRGKSSIYVDAFNLALETVLDQESHLFDEAEHAVFKQWQGLSYEAQYLDIADMPQAIADIQVVRELPDSSSKAEDYPGELEPPEGTTLQTSFTFADRSGECIADLEEASSLLLLDELKALAKDAKVHGKNKKELLRAFRRTSGKQTGLGWSGLKRSDTDESTASAGIAEEDGRETPPAKAENRDAHWV
ncbi:hypothetical protein KC315_g11324, partial [Hortaea werneckii]